MKSSNFAFNFDFRPKRPNFDSSDNKENSCAPRQSQDVSQRTPSAFSITSSQDRCFADQTIESTKSQKENEPMKWPKIPEFRKIFDTVRRTPSESAANNRLHTVKSNPSETESKPKDKEDEVSVIKKKVSQELERIETFQAISKMESDRQIELIKELKANKIELNNKIEAISRENCDLKSQIDVERSERNDLIVRMNNTREMVNKVKEFLTNIEGRMEAVGEVRRAMDIVDGERERQFHALNQTIGDLRGRHTAIVSDLKNEIDSLKSNINDKVVEIEFIKKAFIRLKLVFNSTREQKKKSDQTIEVMTGLLGQHKEELESLRAGFSQIKLESNELIEKLTESDAKNVSNELKIVDLTQNIKALEDEIQKMIEDFAQREEKWTRQSNELLEQTKAQLILVQEEKQNLETLVKEKDELVSDKDKTINDLESTIGSLREENSGLLQLKDENETMIESLQSKANETIIEKEKIEDKLTKEVNELKSELDSKMQEFGQKIADLETRLTELKQMKEQNETTICELTSEKEEIKQNYEKEKEICESKIKTMAELMESAKKDYLKRIDEKDDRIKEYRREHERMRYSNDQLDKKCKELEGEQSTLKQKLCQLTFFATSSKPTTATSELCLTPKLLSPKVMKQDRYRIESPLRVDMSMADEKYEPNKKKQKLKTYGKVRAENIEKGRPTPTKEDDLSWLDNL